jgi:hypothetical protein
MQYEVPGDKFSISISFAVACYHMTLLNQSLREFSISSLPSRTSTSLLLPSQKTPVFTKPNHPDHSSEKKESSPRMPDSKSQARPLRILCFGDSLTEGYSRFGFLMTPYSQWFKSELEVKFWARKERRKVEVVTDGESGDLVTTGSFKHRMSVKCVLRSLCFVHMSRSFN